MNFLGLYLVYSILAGICSLLFSIDFIQTLTLLVACGALSTALKNEKGN